MKYTTLAIAAAFQAAILMSSPAHAVQATALCNATTFDSILLYGLTPQAVARIQAVVKDPKSDPDLYEALWAPKGISASGELKLDLAQDLEEIAAAMRVDPRVAALGVTKVATWTDYWRQYAGFAYGLFFPVPKTVTEFRDTVRDHYYWAASKAEAEWIDVGNAGPEWVRTGESMVVFSSDANRFARPVWEFYHAANGSHFVTATPDECGGLRKNESTNGWKLVNRPYALLNLPTATGACNPTEVAVHRLRNGKDADPAHRYTYKDSLVAEMVARGWIYEGVGLCAYPPSSP